MRIREKVYGCTPAYSFSQNDLDNATTSVSTFQIGEENLTHCAVYFKLLWSVSSFLGLNVHGQIISFVPCILYVCHMKAEQHQCHRSKFIFWCNVFCGLLYFRWWWVCWVSSWWPSVMCASVNVSCLRVYVVCLHVLSVPYFCGLYTLVYLVLSVPYFCLCVLFTLVCIYVLSVPYFCFICVDAFTQMLYQPAASV